MMRTQRYLAQKQGSSFAECEDALASRGGAYAVADGATEAFGARWWARLLVRAWVRRPAADGDGFIELVENLARRAHDHWAAKTLPWYADEKRLQGSYAAFVGLSVEQAGEALRWRAVAVGDCCLFQLRGAALLTALPLNDPAQFGYRPNLVPSRPGAMAASAAFVQAFEGAAQAGDRLLLLSDAVACWFLGCAEGRAEFLEHLEQGRGEALNRLVAAQRQAGRMRNDDVAALLVAIGPAS